MGKKRPGVKLAVWLPTIKSRESTSSRHLQMECDGALKRSRRELQLWFRPHSNRRSEPGVMKVQSPRSPTRDSFGTSPWESRENVPFGCRATENTIWGKVVASPESGQWWILCVKVPVACPNTQGWSRMLTNPFVVGFGCRFKLDNLVPLPSLIPGLLARPSTPF